MNYSQALQLLAVCALVMIPLGACLGLLVRAVAVRVDRRLPPRYLKARAVRRRAAEEDVRAGR